MATITSTKSGLASDPTVWSGGVVPVEGDKVIIAAGHVVTLDGTFTWGDDSVTATLPNAAVNVYGTLKASRTVNSSLTGKGLILTNYGTQGIDFGTESDPLPSGINASLILNKATTPAIRVGLQQVGGASGAANYILNSFWSADTRVRGVKLAAEATAGNSVITLESSTHNWRIGDELMFMKTSTSTSVDDTETRTISDISGASITLNSALTYTHMVALPICNLTCDITIKSYNQVAGQQAYMQTGMPGFNTPATLGYWWKFGGVAFENLADGTGPNRGMFGQTGFGSSPTNNYGAVFKSCSCKLNLSGYSAAVILSGARSKTVFEDFVLLTSGSFVYNASNLDVTRLYAALGGGVGASICASSKFTDSYFSGRNNNATLTGTNTLNTYARCYFFGVSQQILGTGEGQNGTTFIESDFGYTFGYAAKNGFDDRLYRFESWVFGNPQVSMLNCMHGANASTPASNSDLVGSKYSQLRPSAKTEFLNKNNDVLSQEIYYGSHVLRRDNSLKNRGLSSVSIKPISVGADAQRTQTIPCANGQTIRAVGYVRMDTAFYNGGDCNLPTVSLSGLGATPVTFTATSAANNAWQQYDISITNTAGYDGNFTLTFAANAKTISTGTVYFDGVPDAPFITKCRHYGFVFNETSPTREVNPYTVATEATAAAYTGVTINATTNRVTFGAGTIDTLNELYDYSQAWGCLNIDKDMPWTRAGALLSLAAGWTVVDPTITGVTWGGGNVEFGTPGAVTGSFDSNTFRFNAAGTYDISTATFAGTIQFENTSGGRVIVILLPSGIDYVNNSPGTITVQEVVQQAEATVTGVVPGSRIQVWNQTTSTEIANAIVPGTYWTLSYPTGTSFTAGDIVRVRLAWHSGTTAKVPVQYKTVATSAGWSILADQQDDAVYNLNAIDGDTVTEFTADFPNVQLDINDPDGRTTPQRGYAWYVSGQLTADGIRYYHGGMTAEDSFNYRINVANTDMHIQNVNTSAVIVEGARLYRSDGTPVAVPGSGPIQMEYGRAYAVETGVSGLTVSESNKLMGLDTSNLDVAVSSRLATAGYTAPPTSIQNATAVRAELTTELTRVDVNISTRLGSSDYVAPANADIIAIKAKTDTLTNAPTAAANATAVRTELATELARVDTSVSSRLPTSGYTAPDNAGIAVIETKVNTLVNAPSVSEVVSGVEASTLLAKEATVEKAVGNAALAAALSA